MVHVVGMRGIGDCIYQRPFVRQIKECFLETPYPQFYQDLPNVYPVRPETDLRTQSKHMQAYEGHWYRAPVRMANIKIGYRDEGIACGMMRCTGYLPGPMDMPTLGKPLFAEPYVIVRPVTVRAEWFNRSRNPDPKYVAEAARIVRSMGIKVVSMADVEEGKEWIEGTPPEADVCFHKGELGIDEVMGAIQGAMAVVGGIGFIVPACIAYKTPAWIIAGGQGGYNHPAKITDRNFMDLSRMEFAIPENMCMCIKKDHYCDKRIPNHADRFRRWMLDVVAR